jgi:two-component system response regulator QseB
MIRCAGPAFAAGRSARPHALAGDESGATDLKAKPILAMRVLLVEDDVMIGESVRQGLRQDGFSVDWVRDGSAADLALRNQGYDAVLLDLGLPKKDGLEVLKQLRHREDKTAVLIVTARDAVSSRIEGLDCGADDYIVKPFDLDELAARIRAVLRRQSGRAESVIHAGAVTLNPATHEAALDGKPVSLSAREFSLLEVFLSRPGMVFSRDQLEEKLYGWGEEVESNTVEVYIHNLRKKLGQRFIKNIRGVGYTVPKQT